MSALTTEDGTGKSTADSYIASDDASDYLKAIYGPEEAFANAVDSDAKDAILRRACQYIESVYGPKFSGSKLTKAQALAWPRLGATDGAFDIDSDEIPVQLGRAQAEVARRLYVGTEMRPDLERGGAVVSETIDVISIQYSDNAPAQTRFQQVEDLLGLLCVNGGSSLMVSVARS